jgi:hypothetical protein
MKINWHEYDIYSNTIWLVSDTVWLVSDTIWLVSDTWITIINAQKMAFKYFPHREFSKLSKKLIHQIKSLLGLGFRDMLFSSLLPWKVLICCHQKFVIKVTTQKVVAICVNSVWLRVDTQFRPFLFSTHWLSRRGWHNAGIEKSWIADRTWPFNSNSVIGKSYVGRWSNLYFKFTIGAVCSSHRSCCILGNAPILLILFRRSSWFSWTRIIWNEPTPKMAFHWQNRKQNFNTL